MIDPTSNIVTIVRIVVAPLIFFTFLVFCVIVNMRKRKALETIRHETVRKMIESGQPLDWATIRQVLDPQPQVKPGIRYLIMRVVGVILLVNFVWGVCSGGWLMTIHFGNFYTMLLQFGVSFVLALIGVGLLYKSRFVSPSPAESKDEQGR